MKEYTDFVESLSKEQEEFLKQDYEVAVARAEELHKEYLEERTPENKYKFYTVLDYTRWMSRLAGVYYDERVYNMRKDVKG